MGRLGVYYNMFIKAAWDAVFVFSLYYILEADKEALKRVHCNDRTRIMRPISSDIKRSSTRTCYISILPKHSRSFQP